MRDLIWFNQETSRVIMKKSVVCNETRNDKTYLLFDIIRARNELDFPRESYNVGSSNPRWVSRGNQCVKNSSHFLDNAVYAHAAFLHKPNLISHLLPRVIRCRVGMQIKFTMIYMICLCDSQ